jgi:dihydrofolate reductase
MFAHVKGIDGMDNAILIALWQAAMFGYVAGAATVYSIALIHYFITHHYVTHHQKTFSTQPDLRTDEMRHAQAIQTQRHLEFQRYLVQTGRVSDHL